MCLICDRPCFVWDAPHHWPALELDIDETQTGPDPGDGLLGQNFCQDPRRPLDWCHREELLGPWAARVPGGQWHPSVFRQKPEGHWPVENAMPQTPVSGPQWRTPLRDHEGQLRKSRQEVCHQDHHKLSGHSALPPDSLWRTFIHLEIYGQILLTVLKFAIRDILR